MYPPILVLEPSAARSMLQYRFDRIEQARIKAQECKPPSEGFMRSWSNSTFQKSGNIEATFWTADPWHPRHAFCTASYTASPHKPYALYFAWESALTGIETNMMDDRYGPWAMFEQHLMGDIAFAVRQYWHMSRDIEWLRSVGFPLLNGTASFYAARLVKRAGGRDDGAPISYDLPVIMGPDEYQFPIANNAYTNAVARITLEFAAEAAFELGLSGEVYNIFLELAAGIFLPHASSVPGRPDLKGGYHPEYEGFLENRSCKKPCVKQADTILLNFPLGVESDSAMLANDLKFYAEVTDPNGPAMTWAMFAINYFDQKDFQRSGEMFRRGYANMEPPFGVWTEYPSTFEQQGAVNFITGAGGFLQSVIFGTCGMRITGDALTFDPPPPSASGTAATGFAIHSLHYLDSRLRQEVTEDTISFEVLERLREDAPILCLSRQGRERQLHVGERVQMLLGPAIIRACEESSLEQKYSLREPRISQGSSKIARWMSLCFIALVSLGIFLLRLGSQGDQNGQRAYCDRFANAGAQGLMGDASSEDAGCRTD